MIGRIYLDMPGFIPEKSTDSADYVRGELNII